MITRQITPTVGMLHTTEFSLDGLNSTSMGSPQPLSRQTPEPQHGQVAFYEIASDDDEPVPMRSDTVAKIEQAHWETLKN